jgi:DNA primase
VPTIPLHDLPLETVLLLLEGAGYPGFGRLAGNVAPKICCPFHAERLPSCQLYPPPDAHFMCYGCGAHGDLVVLLGKALFPDQTPGWAWYHAWLVLTDGGTTAATFRPGSIDLRESLSTEERGALGTALAHYRDALWGPDPAGREYLFARFPKERRALEAVLHEDGVGYADAAGAARIRETLRPWPEAEQWLRRVGVVRENGGLRLTRRVVLPEARTGEGSLYYQARDVLAPRPADDPYRRVPYLSPPRLPKSAIGLGHARRRPKLPILVVEGPMDQLAARVAGYAAIALLGSSPPGELKRVLAGRDVVDALDNDAGGASARVRLAPHLAGARTTKRLALPPGKDPADVVREGGAIALQRLVD